MKLVKKMPTHGQFVAVIECTELWSGLFEYYDDTLMIYNYDIDGFSKYPGNINKVFKNAIFFIKE